MLIRKVLKFVTLLAMPFFLCIVSHSLFSFFNYLLIGYGLEDTSFNEKIIVKNMLFYVLFNILNPPMILFLFAILGFVIIKLLSLRYELNEVKGFFLWAGSIAFYVSFLPLPMFQETVLVFLTYIVPENFNLNFINFFCYILLFPLLILVLVIFSIILRYPIRSRTKIER